MLAIAGGKGGCGKTTVSLGLADALAGVGRRPVVVDADVDMPDLHERAGAHVDPGFDTVAAGGDASAVVQRNHDLPGVGVVAAGDADMLAAALDRLRRHADPLVVDCPAGAGPDAATPLHAADRSLVVTTPTPESLEDAAKTAAMSRALGTPVAGAVLRETARPSDEYDMASADVGRLVDAPLLATVPYVRGRLRDDAGIRDSFGKLARATFAGGGRRPRRRRT